MNTLSYKTISANANTVNKDWVVVDVKDLPLGRVSAIIANFLRGKYKTNYTPHVDCGDNVIIINAEKVSFTGKKRNDKVYYWHTGYPGGLKERTADKILDGRFPERVMKKAVQRMLPKESPLARKQLSNLRIYSGADHPHSAQEPKIIDFKSMSPKNVKVN